VRSTIGQFALFRRVIDASVAPWLRDRRERRPTASITAVGRHSRWSGGGSSPEPARDRVSSSIGRTHLAIREGEERSLAEISAEVLGNCWPWRDPRRRIGRTGSGC